jgi:hypothetical protein
VTNKNKKRLAGPALKKELETGCRGLVYISETDRPIGPVFEAVGSGTTLTEFVSRNLPASSVSVKENPATLFFDRLTADRDWHSSDDKKVVRRFRRLERMLIDNLAEITMFRAGRVQVEIFVVGWDDEGNIAGIRTSAVET